MGLMEGDKFKLSQFSSAQQRANSHRDVQYSTANPIQLEFSPVREMERSRGAEFYQADS